MDRIQNWIQIVATVAVIVGLLLVIWELRQSQAIARSQNVITLASATVELNSRIADNADVWVAGNAGEKLNRAQQTIYEAIIADKNDLAFQSYYQYFLVTGDQLPTVPMKSFAHFLSLNPGALQTWESMARPDQLQESQRSLGGFYRNYIRTKAHEYKSINQRSDDA